MTNRPYEIDMPSLTKLKVMEDEAMGFTSATAPPNSKTAQRQHPPPASEKNKPLAEANPAERQEELYQRLSGDLDDRCRGTSAADLRQETGGMDVDVVTEDQASHSREMIFSRCEGRWVFADAVLEGHFGVESKAKGKGKVVASLSASEIPISQDQESMQSKADGGDLCMHKSDSTRRDRTADEQEYLIPKEDLLVMLEVGFAESSYWTTADLADALQQPQAYLNEALPQIAIFGPWLGGYPQRWCWRLKPAEEKSEARCKGKGRVVEDEGSW